MNTISIEELKLTENELTAFQFHELGVSDLLKDQLKKLQKIADEKGMIIAFVPEGFENDYVSRGLLICQVSEILKVAK